MVVYSPGYNYKFSGVVSRKYIIYLVTESPGTVSVNISTLCTIFKFIKTHRYNSTKFMSEF